MLSIVFETRPSDIQTHLLYTLFGVCMEACYPGCCLMKGGDSMFGMKIVTMSYTTTIRLMCLPLRLQKLGYARHAMLRLNTRRSNLHRNSGPALLPLDRLIGNLELRRQRHVPLVQQLVARMHLRDLLQQPSDVLIVVLHLLVRRRVRLVPAARLCAMMHLEARLFIPPSKSEKRKIEKKSRRTIRKKPDERSEKDRTGQQY
jgi:hypothetical protein